MPYTHLSLRTQRAAWRAAPSRVATSNVAPERAGALRSVFRRARSASRVLAVAVAISALGFAAWPRSAETQAAAWDEPLATSLTGTWVLAVPEQRASAVREAGIRTALSGMVSLVSSIAANRVRARLPISPRITLRVTPDEIASTFVDGSFASPPGQLVTVPTSGDSSSSTAMTQHLRRGRLEQVFTTQAGRRWNTLLPSRDGNRLFVDTVVRSPRFTTDVRYRIPYRRAE